jgi:hypothetical protein
MADPDAQRRRLEASRQRLYDALASSHDTVLSLRATVTRATQRLAEAQALRATLRATAAQLYPDSRPPVANDSQVADDA